jgi:transglutaminase-like putative cysteine protease
MEATVSFSGQIDVQPAEPSGYINWLEASFYSVPQQSDMQFVELLSASPSTYSLEEDKYGNRYITFRWERPAEGQLPYSIVWAVNVSRLKYALDSAGSLDGEVPGDATKFLEADNLTAWTPYLKAKAESITNGSNSTLEAARRLALWINSQVKYDKTCWEVSMPATQVFAERRGVCDEFSNLFISMCRALGIPARYVEGLVYSGRDWTSHAWTEVYAGRWVPVDPTYDEIGFADSSHIVLAVVHGDEEVFNALNWQGDGVSASFGQETINVSVSKTSQQSLFSLDVEAKEELAGTEMTNVIARVRNLANTYVIASCSINMPVEMALLDSQEKSVLLAPQSGAELSWRIASPPDLDRAWLHKMPVEITCFPGLNETQTITVNPKKDKSAVPNASLDDLTVINRSIAYVKVRNDGTEYLDDLTVTLCVEDGNRTCTNQTADPLKPGEITGLNFTSLYVSEGDNVSVLLSSEDFRKVSEEALHLDLQTPPAPPVYASESTSTPSGKNEDQLILIATLVVLILIVLVAIAAVVVKR